MDKVNINIYQINLHHCREATAELKKLLSNGRRYVCLIQEPWVSGASVLGLANCGVLYKADGQEGPRACIMMSRDVSGWRLPQFMDRDTATVVIAWSNKGEKKKAVLTSAYMPNDGTGEDPCPPPMVERVVHHAEVSQCPLIVGCDANSHNVVWGSTNTNDRGEALMEFIMRRDLIISNRGNHPTFANAIRTEVLDLTLTNTQGEGVVRDWRVTHDISSSDHLMVRFDVVTDPPNVTYCSNPRKTNWELYKRSLVNNLPPLKTEKINSIEELETDTQEVTLAINRAIIVACPKRKKGKGKCVPWWTQEVNLLRKEMRKTHRKAIRSKMEADWEIYRRNRTQWRRALNGAKRNSWRNFCEEVEALSTAARLQRVMKNGTHYQPSMMQRVDGTYTTTKEEMLQLMLKHHFPENENRDAAQRRPCFDLLDCESISHAVTQKAIMAAVQSFGSYKAPGDDGIRPCHLQQGIESLAPHLLRLFKASLAMGYIPTSWRNTVVVFLPKPGKETYDNPASYRPISLSSSLLKTLERLVDWEMKFSNPRINHMPNQYAYRAGVSTETALHALVSRIEKALMKGEYALSIFMDIEGAFNNVTFEAINDAMMESRIPHVFSRWITFMITNRKVITHVQGATLSKLVQRGTPQGGVLSPLLWNLVADGLLRRLNTELAVYSQAFSDDLACLLMGIDIGTLRDIAQRTIQIVDRWTQNKGLNLNPNKTEVVVFTTKKNWHMRPLTLRGVALKQVDQVKYLGVTLDKKLTWTPHIQQITTKAKRAMMTCRRMTGQTWGLKPHIAHWLYTAVVRPIITYGAHVWVTALGKVTTCKKLGKVQRLACMGIIGAFPTTPTAAMEIVLDLQPLDIFLKGVACMSWKRLEDTPGHIKWSENPRNLKRNTHMEVCIKLKAEIPILGMPGDKIPKVRDLSTRYKMRILTREAWKEHAENETNAGDVLRVYTDGSRKNDLSGAAYCIQTPEGYDSESIALGAFPTVFQAEVYAIKAACSVLNRNQTRNKQVTFYSDSQAAIRALMSTVVTSRVVLDCRNELQRLADANEITISWIPGHEGYEGNEAADVAAKRATEEIPYGPEPFLPIAEGSYKGAVKDWCRREHTIVWNEHTDCRQSKVALAPPTKTRRKQYCRFPRSTLRKIVGVQTGHCALNRHLKLIGEIPAALCKKCSEEDETVEHYLCKCPAYAHNRTNIWGAPTIPYTQTNAMSLKSIALFLRETKRLDEWTD